MINKSKDWDSILGKGSAEHLVKAGNFISTLMSAQQSATITHRYQKDKKLATHLALEDFYTSLDGFIDDLTETLMGYYGARIENLKVQASLMDNPLSYLTDFIKYIEKNRNFCDESFVQNQIDEIMQLSSKLKYKLIFIVD